MNPFDQRLDVLADRARKVAVPHDTPAPLGFSARVLSRVRREPDEASLWLRFSLVSLPVAASVMIICLLWLGTDLPHDVDDLANSFIQTPFLP